MIIVEAAPDPVQKALRQTKKIWNKEVSSFIDNLIDFKKMMNGQPSKFFKQKSYIKDPIPGDPSTILNQLSGNFQDLAQKGQGIVQQQLSYSQTRKKKQPKKKGVIPTSSQVEVAPTTSPSGIDLSSQLTVAMDMYELIAEGSTPVSRFFARLLSPTIGSSPKARIRRYRMSLLKSSLEVYKDLNRFQATITGSSPESIFEATKILHKIENNWNFFKTGLKTYKGSDNKSADHGGKISFNDDKTDAIVADYVTNALPLGIGKKNKLISYIIKYKKIIGAGSKSIDLPRLQEIIDIISEEYNKILFELNLKYNTQGSSLAEIRKMADLSKDEPKSKPTPVRIQPSPEALTNILDDYKYASNFTNINPKKLYSLIASFKLEKDPVRIPQITEEYAKLLADLNSKLGTNGTSLRQIWETKSSKAEYGSWRLESLGQYYMEKWLGKLKHQLSPFDKTSAHRLEIYQTANKARENINIIMDSLEDALDIDKLEKLSGEVDKSMKEMQFLMGNLETTIRGGDFDKTFMDLLDKGKITQLSPDLDQKQKEHLQRMIERRRLLGLTNLYQGRK
jgi:hypothetical protein